MPFTVVDMAPTTALCRRASTSLEEIGDALGALLPSVHAAAKEVGVVGPPYCAYVCRDAVMEIEAGVPIAEPVAVEPPLLCVQRPGGRAVTLLHEGPYAQLSRSWDALFKHLDGQEILATWEEYLTDPQAQPDQARWKTRLIAILPHDAAL